MLMQDTCAATGLIDRVPCRLHVDGHHFLVHAEFCMLAWASGSAAVLWALKFVIHQDVCWADCDYVCMVLRAVAAGTICFEKSMLFVDASPPCTQRVVFTTICASKPTASKVVLSSRRNAHNTAAAACLCPVANITVRLTFFSVFHSSLVLRCWFKIRK